MTASHPVVSKVLITASGDHMSPDAMTGMWTASLTAFITARSAVPAYPCLLVRPCTQTALAPAPAAIFAISGALTDASSHPERILTVTGTGEHLTRACVSRDSVAGSRKRAAPSPFFVTLWTGQAAFRSMRSYG